MRAIILAAGRGIRLQLPEDSQLPKCLLRFDGMSLLERHLRMLKSAGIEDVVLALGFRHELVEAELDRIDWKPRPGIVLNMNFALGSVLTVRRYRRRRHDPRRRYLVDGRGCALRRAHHDGVGRRESTGEPLAHRS